MSVTQAGIVFYPWLKLVKAETSGATAELQFEVLRDPVPALQILVYRRKTGGPRKIHACPIGSNSVRQGSRITLTIPLLNPCPVSDLYVKVQADVEWGAAPLRVEGVKDGRVRLTHLP